MGHKTTKKHFKIFQKECEKWIDFFGLKNWEVGYTHEKDDDNLATCEYSLGGGWATISLATNWQRTKTTTVTVKECAFHEVCELLLARLMVLARSRFTASSEIGEAAHAIIRRMENSVFRKLP